MDFAPIERLRHDVIAMGALSSSAPPPPTPPQVDMPSFEDAPNMET